MFQVKNKHLIHIHDDVTQAVVPHFSFILLLSFSRLLGFIDSSRGKVTVEHNPSRSPSSSSSTSIDGSISLETTYVLPSIDNESTTNKKVRFIVQEQSSTNGNLISTHSKFNEMTQQKNLSFVDAVNSKHLDLSTGLFSSSTLSSSTINSPASSPAHTTVSISPVGADSTSSAAITLKAAIDANILDAYSAYVVDTVDQR